MRKSSSVASIYHTDCLCSSVSSQRGQQNDIANTIVSDPNNPHPIVDLSGDWLKSLSGGNSTEDNGATVDDPPEQSPDTIATNSVPSTRKSQSETEA